MSAWTRHQFGGKADRKIVPPRSRTPCWKGPSADSEEKREPVSDIDPGLVDSLKALDPNRPIREADMCSALAMFAKDPISGHRAFCTLRIAGADADRYDAPCCQ